MSEPVSARMRAAITAKTEIEPGSPEEAYQAVNLVKMLWGFRRRDVDDWKEGIDRWVTPPEAWKRIPEMRPYGTARAMIEAEICEDYDAFREFVRAVLGNEYAAKIGPELHDGPGGNNNPQGLGGKSGKTLPDDCQGDNCNVDKVERGNSTDYLTARLLRESPDTLRRLDAGEFRSARAAAIAAGIIDPEKYKRHSLPADPVAAGRYLRQRVDGDWITAMVEAYYEEQP